MNYFEKITEGFRLKIKGCVSDNNSALQVKIIVSLSFKQPWIGESLTSMKKKTCFLFRVIQIKNDNKGCTEVVFVITFFQFFFGQIILAIPIRESIPRARQRHLDPFVICYGFLCFQTVPWVHSRHGHCGAGGGKNFIRAAAGTIPVGLLFWPRSHSSNLTETRSSFIKNNFVEIMEWVGYLLIA